MLKKLTTVALALVLGLLLLGCETSGRGYGYHGDRDYGYHRGYGYHHPSDRYGHRDFYYRDRDRGYNYQEPGDRGYDRHYERYNDRRP